MAEPADIRDETCTNLAILLKMLVRNIKPGETIPLIVTRKQLIQIEEVLLQDGISVHHESLPEDLLVRVTRPV